MDSRETAELVITDEEPTSAGTADWSVDLTSEAPARVGGWRRAGLVAALALVMLAPTSRNVSYDLADTLREGDSSTTLARMLVPWKRKMTLAEARQRALEMLKEAEARRERFAQEEAAHASVWEAGRA